MEYKTVSKESLLQWLSDHGACEGARNSIANAESLRDWWSSTDQGQWLWWAVDTAEKCSFTRGVRWLLIVFAMVHDPCVMRDIDGPSTAICGGGHEPPRLAAGPVNRDVHEARALIADFIRKHITFDRMVEAIDL